METIRTVYWINLSRTAIVEAMTDKLTGSLHGPLYNYWRLS